MSFSGKTPAIILVVCVLVIGAGAFFLSNSNDPVDNHSNNSDNNNGDNSDYGSSGGGNNSTTKYTISVVKSNGGKAIGAGTFTAGSTVVLTATPYDGYLFDGWYNNDNLYSTSSIISFKAQENLTLTPKFVPSIHEVKISINYPDAGTISSGGQIAHGSSFTCSTTTKSHAYTFDGWYAGDKLKSKSQSYTFTVNADVVLEARYSITHDASFSTSLSTSAAPSIITMMSLYNTEVSYRTWTVTDTLTGKTIKFEDGVNGSNGSTFVRIDVGTGVNITQTITYSDGARASKTANVVVDQSKITTFNWKYHEDTDGDWWNPFDSNKDPTSMNRNASIQLSMNFSWYYKYASDPIVRGYQPAYLTTFVNSNDQLINALAGIFKNKTSGWRDVDRANYILHFVQSIPYKYDDQGDAVQEHWNYPAETLWRNQGDCEDHAILYAALMKALGYKVVLLQVSTKNGGHLAVGLDVNGGSGTYYNYLSSKYYYCEATPGLTQSYWFNVGYMPAGDSVTAIYQV